MQYVSQFLRSKLEQIVLLLLNTLHEHGVSHYELHLNGVVFLRLDTLVQKFPLLLTWLDKELYKGVAVDKLMEEHIACAGAKLSVEGRQVDSQGILLGHSSVSYVLLPGNVPDEIVLFLERRLQSEGLEEDGVDIILIAHPMHSVLFDEQSQGIHWLVQFLHINCVVDGVFDAD